MHLSLLLMGLVAIATIGSPAVAAGDPAEGRVRAKRCAPCHGIDGLAKQPQVPNIAGESEIYLTKQLNAFKSGERQDPQMSLVVEELSDEEIADLVAWYSQIALQVTLPD